MVDEKLLEQLSAYADGELDAAARAQVERALASEAGLRRELAQLRKLDEAAAALPVPDMPAGAAEALWAEIAERIGEAEPARAASARGRIAPALPDAPVIPEERWQGVWDGIRQRTGSAPAVGAGPLDADLTPAGMKVVGSGRNIVVVDTWRRPIPLWRTVAALAVAASVLIALTFVFLLRTRTGRQADPPRVANSAPEPAASEALDSRYRLVEKKLPGIEATVVCFFLKDADAELNENGGLE